jgi:hypothetical protein
MLWASYGKLSQEGIKVMIVKAQNRAEAVGKLVEALDGKMYSYHLLLNGSKTKKLGPSEKVKR